MGVCMFLNNVKSKQQVQLQGYFNPQAVPKRIMGVLYLPGTTGSKEPFTHRHGTISLSLRICLFSFVLSLSQSHSPFHPRSPS